DHNRGWLSSRSDVLLNHLRNCEFQPVDVCLSAQEEQKQRDALAANKGARRQQPRVPVPGVILTRRLLPRAVTVMRTEILAQVSGEHGTAQCDGWSGLNNHHYIAFMVTISNKVYTVRVHDASNERKTAQLLYDHMIEVLRILDVDWKVVVVGFTTDASGEARKARKMLTESHPHLICPDCYAHQVGLSISHYIPRDLIHLKLNLSRAGQTALSVIRAVLTRWTAHYLAYRRLLELGPALRAMTSDDAMLSSNEKRLITGDRASRTKAREMVAIIDTPGFWQSLARMKTHLEPLARAANIAQAASCRLDQTLLTFGDLFVHYTYLISPENETEADANNTACTAILDSLEKRWAKSDQDVFIAATILNPFIKVIPFRQTVQWLSLAGVLSLLTRVYCRVFQVATSPPQLFDNLQDFFNNQGTYKELQSYAEVVSNEAQRNNHPLDPRKVYNGIKPLGGDHPPLSKLALHLLSICTNSASCERLFSVFGNTLTKLRNRLGNNSLTALAELKMHIRDEHLRGGTKERLKRFFGERKTQDTGPPLPPLPQGPTPIPAQLHPPIIPAIDGVADEFTEIATSFMLMLDDDDDDETLEFPSKISIKLSDLFDYRSTHWTEIHRRSASRTLDEELELYELVDLDADGDVDIDIDDAVGDILAN
ncbi:hypothetical protein PLEOSDRAFT_1049064, partial [Pleurotus ostreatus PC15]